PNKIVSKFRKINRLCADHYLLKQKAFYPGKTTSTRLLNSYVNTHFWLIFVYAKLVSPSNPLNTQK
ncbi:hypothetical protein, partial [uncultured Muribaculum sp.]|uniref:hypothetical protein n=1 Tax=uncultured Muribaculum sp. TaxID=1918613 RepID=UPI00259C8ABD